MCKGKLSRSFLKKAFLNITDRFSESCDCLETTFMETQELHDEWLQLGFSSIYLTEQNALLEAACLEALGELDKEGN